MTDDDETLEAMFGAARSARPRPPEALLSRIEADAASETADRALAKNAPPSASGGPRFSGFRVWPTAMGLLTAGVAGVWIGLADPAGLVSSQFALGAFASLDAGDSAFGYSDLAWGLE